MRAIEEQLKAIREEYFSSLENKFEGIARDWRILVEDGWDGLIMKDLIRRVHNLAGSGAMYGLREISQTAGILEKFLTSLHETEPVADRAAAIDIEGASLLGQLRESMLEPARNAALLGQ